MRSVQSPRRDSRWEYDESGEHVPKLMNLLPTLPTTTSPTLITGVNTTTTAGTLPSYNPPPLSFITPNTSTAPPASRVIQFNDNPIYLNDMTPLQPTWILPPNQPIAPPQPAPRTTVPNLLKIIKSWDLKYPGKLDADDFIFIFYSFLGLGLHLVYYLP